MYWKVFKMNDIFIILLLLTDWQEQNKRPQQIARAFRHLIGV